jgi:hypothetical protein
MLSIRRLNGVLPQIETNTRMTKKWSDKKKKTALSH